MKRLFFLVLIICLVALAYVIKVYNKPFEDLSKAEMKYKLSSTELFTEFQDKEEAATKMYINQPVELEGIVESIQKNEQGIISLSLQSGSLMGNVICELDPKVPVEESNYQQGKLIKVRGICTGKLLDVIISQCVIIANR
ncbi:MAG: OB-fold putative lipoprotein [Bacteroidota bacterium]|nr:OB-fold putative lipoprotein [Bacteroidota bacterium]